MTLFRKLIVQNCHRPKRQNSEILVAFLKKSIYDTFSKYKKCFYCDKRTITEILSIPQFHM